MYSKNINNQISIILLLWVDAISIASKTEIDLITIKAKLKSFKMTDLGKLSWFLGIQLECKNTTIKMNKYIKKILSKFKMGDCKPSSTPCKKDINKINNKVKFIDNRLYRKIIGSLIYIMIAVRADIYNTIIRLSQDLVKPTTIHESETCSTLFERHNKPVTNI